MLSGEVNDEHEEHEDLGTSLILAPRTPQLTHDRFKYFENTLNPPSIHARKDEDILRRTLEFIQEP